MAENGISSGRISSYEIVINNQVSLLQVQELINKCVQQPRTGTKSAMTNFALSPRLF